MKMGSTTQSVTTREKALEVLANYQLWPKGICTWENAKKHFRKKWESKPDCELLMQAQACDDAFTRFGLACNDVPDDVSQDQFIPRLLNLHPEILTDMLRIRGVWGNKGTNI